MINFLIIKLFEYVQSAVSIVNREVQAFEVMFNIKKKLDYYKRKNFVTADIFRANVRKHPNKPCIIYNDVIWTFSDMESYSNKIANYFLNELKLKKGDCVALFMENQPEHVGIWLGLSKIGVITALINTNLKSQQLLHSINVAKSKYIIYNSNLSESIKTIKDDLSKDIGLIVHLDCGEINSFDDSINLKSAINDISDKVVEIDEPITSDDVLMYIYTSGTTGLPKPGIIKQSRYFGAGFAFFDSAGLHSGDKVYVSLPIYHGNGCFIGIGSAIICGATVVLKRKFSASNFWKDCIENDCTAFIYVGEICRFLVNQPPSILDKQHRIRKAIGNGLRENVWKEFYQRFDIKCVEFYAATEGNCTMINFMSKIGACGFVPFFNKLFRIYPVTIIKIDDEMVPIRDRNGNCIECAPGEKGLCIGIIGKRPNTAYSGYANNTKASNTKIIENVFRQGQKAFNSGDLMVLDSLGFIYFCDRLGDNYRWRGENVATVEIENVISKYLDSAETVVYGVEIPGEEGKTGMAAILTNIPIDFRQLSAHLKTNLPAYARPMFVRLIKDLEYTGTFKVKKNKLAEEGYNLDKTNEDSIFYFDIKEQLYKEFDFSIYQAVLNRQQRF